MLGKIEGRRIGDDRKRWLDGITGSMEINLVLVFSSICDPAAGVVVTETTWMEEP